MKNVLIYGCIFIFFVIVSGCGINTSPGSGEKIGQIVRINKQGMVNKTWEAQLIRGGMSGGTGSFGTVPFDFTIEDEEVAKQAQEYMQKQTEIVIKYRMEFIYSLFRSDSSGNFLIGIRLAKPEEATSSASKK